MAQVNVILLGLFRLDTGLHELQLEAGKVKDLYPQLLQKARENKPETTVTQADLNGCVALVNGKPARKGTKLAQGDTVHLMSPVCGG